MNSLIQMRLPESAAPTADMRLVLRIPDWQIQGVVTAEEGWSRADRMPPGASGGDLRNVYNVRTPIFHMRRPSPVTRPTRIPRMTSGELSRALDAVGISPQALADYCGVEPRQVQRWLGQGDRMDEPPAYLRTLLALLKMPGAVTLAEAVIDTVEVAR